VPDTDTSPQTRRPTQPRHKAAPQEAACRGGGARIKGHMTSEIRSRSHIQRKPDPRKMIKTHVRSQLSATDPVVKNIGPIKWPQRACRYHVKQENSEHLRARTLWAPCSRPVCARTGQKWGPEIGPLMIAGPHLPQGPLWATPPYSAPAPACTHPMGALFAPGFCAHRPKMGAQNRPADNCWSEFATGATVGHTPLFSPRTCVHTHSGRPARARIARAPAKNGGPKSARR